MKLNFREIDKWSSISYVCVFCKQEVSISNDQKVFKLEGSPSYYCLDCVIKIKTKWVD